MSQACCAWSHAVNISITAVTEELPTIGSPHVEIFASHAYTAPQQRENKPIGIGSGGGTQDNFCGIVKSNKTGEIEIL